MTTILLCRHSEVLNPGNLFYGRLPKFGLSENGRILAENLAECLSREPVAALYSSPLLRARQTTRIIQKYHLELPIRTSTDLLELFSSWQGTPWTQLGGKRFYDPPCDPGDESVLDIATRMHRFVLKSVRRHPGKTIVAVSHSDPILILLMHLLGKPLTEDEIKRNGSLVPGLATVNRLYFDDDGSFQGREYVAQNAMKQPVLV